MCQEGGQLEYLARRFGSSVDRQIVDGALHSTMTFMIAGREGGHSRLTWKKLLGSATPSLVPIVKLPVVTFSALVTDALASRNPLR